MLYNKIAVCCDADPAGDDEYARDHFAAAVARAKATHRRQSNIQHWQTERHQRNRNGNRRRPFAAPASDSAKILLKPKTNRLNRPENRSRIFES
ncbi:MAG: hypothetical protein U0Y68_21125 [Blastocatellia bacterium]